MALNSVSRSTLLWGAGLLGFGLLTVACKPPAPPPAAPKGWFKEPTGWKFECYHPPDWSSLQETDRRMARAEAVSAIISQWSGKREDGISFDSQVVEDVEVTVLGRPDSMEGVVAQNLELCRKVSTGQADADAWYSWVRSLPGKLTAGECMTPLNYTMFDYLEIGDGWQRALPICKGNKIRIWATTQDKFRLTDKGPWITVVGDPAGSATGDYPCNTENCKPGQLIMRFKSEAGVESILPVGHELIWEAPENGEIMYRINDNTLYDNIWFKNGGITDHAAVTVEPAN
jgi:hypothetical protein